MSAGANGVALLPRIFVVIPIKFGRITKINKPRTTTEKKTKNQVWRTTLDFSCLSNRDEMRRDFLGML